MNKVFCKTIAVLVSVLILVSLFTACSKPGSTETTPTTKAAAGSDKTTATQEATEKPREKLKITWVWTDRKAASEGDNEVLQYLNEKFNIDYQPVFIPSSELEEKLSVMIAGGDEMDCTFGYFSSANKMTYYEKLIQGDQIIPLNDYLEEYGQNLLKDVPEYNWNFATDKNGNIWFVPDVSFGSKNFLFVRKDWMEKFNITAPKTIDEFEAMLKTFRDGDPDGNNVDDTYPIVSEKINNFWDCFQASFTEHGNSWFEKDGKLVPDFMDPNYKVFLSAIRKWFEEGYVHPEQVILKSEQAKDLATRGIGGVFPNYYSLSYQNEIREAIPGADVTYIDWPVGPSGRAGAMTRNTFSGGLVIMKRAKTGVPERIIEMLDWFQTPEGTLFQWYGIKDKHWVMDDKGVIGPGPGVDPAKPAYNAQYLMNGGDTWKYFKESTLVSPPIFSETRQAALSGKYPSIDKVDFMFPYVWAGTQTEPVYQTLDDTMFKQMFIDIVSGNSPVDYFDEWLQEWLAAGGQTYIDERTEQYFALKPLYGAK